MPDPAKKGITMLTALSGLLRQSRLIAKIQAGGGLRPSMFGKKMKPLLLLLVCACVCPFAHAGGSIAWDEVRVRISKSDSEIVKFIENNFEVNRVGGGTRLGHQFGERVGERIPPYDFDAVRKSTGEKYHLQISESEDFEFTGRYKFIWQKLSEK